MNERIKQLAEQAETKEIGYYFFDREKFAELIVKECIYTIQMKVVRNGTNTPENLRTYEHIKDIADKFAITFPMDYP